MHRAHIIATSLLAMVVFQPRRADACSVSQPRQLQIDPAEEALDRTPPAAPEITEVIVRRGTAGAACSSNSCDDIGMIRILLAQGSDDRTASAELGYRLTLIDGELPAGIELPAAPILGENDELWLSWIDGATDDQDDLTFRLAVTTVDRAGNESAASPDVDVVDVAGGSCAVGRGPGSLAPLLLVFAFLALRARS